MIFPSLKKDLQARYFYLGIKNLKFISSVRDGYYRTNAISLVLHAGFRDQFVGYSKTASPF